MHFQRLFSFFEMILVAVPILSGFPRSLATASSPCCLTVILPSRYCHREGLWTQITDRLSSYLRAEAKGIRQGS
jgi:hypothetical protein